jgi:hypothetical protein
MITFCKGGLSVKNDD